MKEIKIGSHLRYMLSISIRELFRGLYRLCLCGCGELIKCTDKRGRFREFKNYHHTKGNNHGNWKGGIIKDFYGYIRELRRDHPKTDRGGRVRKHRLVYEEYYNVCLLPWTDIHHINGNKQDNRIENLTPMFRSSHIKKHMMGNKHGITTDHSNTQCSKCGSNKTSIHKKKNGELIPHWYRNEKDGWKCHKCYQKEYLIMKAFKVGMTNKGNIYILHKKKKEGRCGKE